MQLCLFSRLFAVTLNDNVFGKRLESLAVGLNHSDGEVTGLASVDITNDPGLSSVRSADDRAAITILWFAVRFSYHANLLLTRVCGIVCCAMFNVTNNRRLERAARKLSG